MTHSFSGRVSLPTKHILSQKESHYLNDTFCLGKVSLPTRHILFQEESHYLHDKFCSRENLITYLIHSVSGSLIIVGWPVAQKRPIKTRTRLEIPCYLPISWGAKCRTILDHILSLTTVKFPEKTHIFPLLTHLEPTMRISDGQIPPDSMTHPLITRLDKWNFSWYIVGGSPNHLLLCKCCFT